MSESRYLLRMVTLSPTRGSSLTSASISNSLLMFSGVMTSRAVPAAAMRPFSMAMTRSQYLAAKIRSWVTMMTSSPLSLESLVMRSIRSNWWLMSRCSVGSSSRSISGSCTSARAIITLRLSPPDSSSMSLSANLSTPVSLIAS